MQRACAETKCVYCAVRTAYLYIIYINFHVEVFNRTIGTTATNSPLALPKCALTPSRHFHLTLGTHKTELTLSPISPIFDVQRTVKQNNACTRCRLWKRRKFLPHVLSSVCTVLTATWCTAIMSADVTHSSLQQRFLQMSVRYALCPVTKCQYDMLFAPSLNVSTICSLPRH